MMERIRSEMVLDDERIRDRELGSAQRLGFQERGKGFAVVKANVDDDNRQMRNFGQVNDQGVSSRGNDTASKFQWTYLLNEPGVSRVDGVKRVFRDGGNVGYGRRYDGLVENSEPVDNETLRNVSNYSRDGGSVEYCGVPRNVSGVTVEEPNYHGHVRNVADLRAEDNRNTRKLSRFQVEDAEYNGHIRNVSGLRAEDNRNTRNLTRFQVEDAEYNGHSRNLNDRPVEEAAYSRRVRWSSRSVEGADYQRHTRSVTDLPVEGADYQRHTRNVTGLSIEDGGGPVVREYPLDRKRQIAIELYDNGNFLTHKSEGNSRSLTPRSQSNDLHTSYCGSPYTNLQGPRQEGLRHPSDGLGTDGGSHRIVYSTAGTNTHPIPSLGATSLRTECNQHLGQHLHDIYPDSQISGKVYRRVLSKDNYDKYENVAPYNDRGYVSENDALSPPLPRYKYSANSPECALEKDRLHSSNYTHQEVPMVDINDFSRTAHEMEYDGVDLESMNRFIEYGSETHHETSLYEEECPSEFAAHDVSYDDQTWNTAMQEEGELNLVGNSQRNLGSQYVDLYDQSQRKPKRKHKFVEKANWPKHRTSTLAGRLALSYGNRDRPAEPENELAHPKKRSSHHVNTKANARISKSKPRLPFGGLSKELQSRLSNPSESGSNDIKNRLKYPRFVPRLHGPQASSFFKGNFNSCVKSSLNVNHSPSNTQSYNKSELKNIKKRLKLTPQLDVCQPFPPISHRGLDLDPQQRPAARSFGSTKEVSVSIEADIDHSILKVKPTGEDPPENSEEFKRQVDHWFLKCTLYLNANPGRHKKFKELGNTGTLKCVICSSAKEFTQTKDVATHAFTSLKVGLRAPHLGFHRALCVLMGWNPEVATNGRWVCKSLPDVEAQALKEDIILWPPVFIIHNGSARDIYNSDQAKISIEKLENFLRDMGLREGKGMVCYGKQGNPNIMLVKFSGTLSSLQEAERLHNIFAEKKRGKFELLELAASGGSSKEVAQEPEDKVEDNLYGYLGIVEDFDKLKYDMRQQYVAKSKREILAHVDHAI